MKDFLKKSKQVARAAAKLMRCVSNGGILRRSRAIPFSTKCIICGDTIDASTAFRAPCSHDFCHECVIKMVELASRDEKLLPLRCCTRLLPIDPVLEIVPCRQRAVFQEKLREASVPPPRRVYCPKASCSTYLGEAPKWANSQARITCPTCLTGVCIKCKNATHPGSNCQQNILTLQVKKLAEEKGWQTCPGCKMIVERIEGCNNMSCRCGAEFCYRCGTRKCSKH